MVKKANYKQNTHNVLILGGLILSVVIIIITAYLINQNRFNSDFKAGFFDSERLNCFRACIENNSDCNVCRPGRPIRMLPTSIPMRFLTPKPTRPIRLMTPTVPLITIPPQTQLPGTTPD